MKFDYKFFVGSDSTVTDEQDVVVLSCQDYYNGLPEKVLEIIGWARLRGYDYLLKLDDDVYCRPERLHIPVQDYVGHAYGNPRVASGAAYWLSAAAMDSCIAKWKRRSNAEDHCVAYSLARAGIALTEDHRYRIGWKSLPKDEGENEFPHPDNDTITFHMYHPSQMIAMHENWDKRKQFVA